MSKIVYINRDAEIAAILPKSYRTRWTATRKAVVVEAIERGVLRVEEAMERYRLSLAELRSWTSEWGGQQPRERRAGRS
ncbi:hypothetical protein GCM10011371_13170 [Novosphingobium marinum]|uniref:Transposase n=1 Tax=Novosphingobium marinum TaxID=1514948 RepID=A0A7Y9XVU8_9SPHN|nr:DUF1153 domain-containing protein [Novosphingobium marinum]NYH95425.1 hypothetical protein [Novosphingobium marinum]GGC26967.1 hypothetical protein GCM10011371_13170 [Novosphingobium marinum]